MWVVKGILLGIGLFILSGITYIGIRVRIGLYRLAQAVKAGTASHAGGVQWDIRGLFYMPIFWLLLLAAIALGLWIVRARMQSA